MKHIFIDGNNMLFRAVASNTKFVDSKKGQDNYAFFESNMKNWIIQMFLRDLYKNTVCFLEVGCKIYVVWDKKLNKDVGNWRNEILPEYKENRKTSVDRDLVHEMSGKLNKILKSMGIYSIFPYSVEGDDVIYYLVNKLEGSKIIVSLDKDFYQCISDDCSVYNPVRKKIISLDNFKEFANVEKKDFILYKSIMGDPSDNIKGLYRYGKVKAKKLVENWEEESKKLDEEQMKSIELARQVIDLGSRTLDERNIRAIEMQIENPAKKVNDTELTKIFDEVNLSDEVRMLWDNFFNLEDFEDFLTEYMKGM